MTREDTVCVNLKQLGGHGGTYEVKPTNQNCTVCQNAIQPGQLYVPGDLGPRHLGCSK